MSSDIQDFPFVQFEGDDDQLDEDIDLSPIEELAAHYVSEIQNLTKNTILLYLRMPLVPCSIAALSVSFAERFDLIDDRLGILMNFANACFASAKLYYTSIDVSRSNDETRRCGRKLHAMILQIHEKLALQLREILDPYPEIQVMMQLPETVHTVIPSEASQIQM